MQFCSKLCRHLVKQRIKIMVIGRPHNYSTHNIQQKAFFVDVTLKASFKNQRGKKILK